MPDLSDMFRPPARRMKGRDQMTRKRKPSGTGEPPNRVRSPGRGTPGRMPKEGDTRTMKVMTYPPKTITQVYRNGKWVNAPGKAAGTSRGRKPMPKQKKPKGMGLNEAIESMQGRKPWN